MNNVCSFNKFNKSWTFYSQHFLIAPQDGFVSVETSFKALQWAGIVPEQVETTVKQTEKGKWWSVTLSGALLQKLEAFRFQLITFMSSVGKKVHILIPDTERDVRSEEFFKETPFLIDTRILI